MKKLIFSISILLFSISNSEAVVHSNATPQIARESGMIFKDHSKNHYPKSNKLEKAASGSKTQVVAFLLCFFLGTLGIHRFYTGHILIGIIQLFTAGGLGIWVLVDFIRILVGTYKDSDGNNLEPW